MSVIIEGISVVLRIFTIEQKYNGGLVQYQRDCPNSTFCADEHLARVGFLAPPDVGRYLQGLEQQGLIFKQDGKCVDIAIVDQQRGFIVPCDWLNFGRHPKGVAYCSLKGTEPGEIAVPSGWKLEDSLSVQFNFVSNEEKSERMEFLRHENGVDVFLDKQTGKTVYMGRLKDDEGMTSAEEYFDRGVALIKPYIFLVGVPSANPNTEQGRKDIRQGIEYLQVVIKMYPEHWLAYWQIGKAFEAIGDNEQAYENFKKAYEIKPDEVDVCRELMLSCLKLGNADEGVSVAWAAVQLEPNNAGLWCNMGLALLLKAQLAKAKQAAEKALEIDPSDKITKNLLMVISEVQSGRWPQPRKMSDLTG